MPGPNRHSQGPGRRGRRDAGAIRRQGGRYAPPGRRGARDQGGDRVDVALASGADGVRVGSDDMAPADARALLGREAIIGLSIKTIAQAEAAPVELVGVCIGGVFATASKDNPDPPIGLAGLRMNWALMRARRGSPAAPSPASTLAPDPSAAARELRAIVDRAVTMRVDP